MAEYYQTCTLVLSDGRRLTFTGQAQCPDTEIETIKVVEVQLSTQHPLPDDTHFEPLQ